VAEYLDHFIQMLRSEKYYSPHTCLNYRRDLNQFQTYLAARNIDSWQAVTYNLVSGFAAQRHRQGRKSRTIQRELSSIRSFYQFLIRNDLVDIAHSHTPVYRNHGFVASRIGAGTIYHDPRAVDSQTIIG